MKSIRQLMILLCAAGLAAGCVSHSPYPDRSPPPASDPGASGDGAPTGEVPAGAADRAEPPLAPTPRARNNPETPTLALLRQSDRAADGGDLETAIAYVERAIRLDARDGALWLRLARLQLAAQRPASAEQLAQKAIALANSGGDEQRQAWLLLADAREAQGDSDGAARIRQRWGTYRG